MIFSAPKSLNNGNAMYVRMVPAVSASTAPVATPTGNDVECSTFTAYLRDPAKPVSPATLTKLVRTDKLVTVLHDDQNTAMVVDAELMLGQTVDGYWFVIKWIC